MEKSSVSPGANNDESLYVYQTADTSPDVQRTSVRTSAATGALICISQIKTRRKPHFAVHLGMVQSAGPLDTGWTCRLLAMREIWINSGNRGLTSLILLHFPH